MTRLPPLASFGLNFLAYIGLFQALFLVIPINFYFLIHFRFVFLETSNLAGVACMIVLPLIVIPIFNRSVVNKWITSPIRKEPVAGFSEQELKSAVGLAFLLGILCLFQFTLSAYTYYVGVFSLWLMNCSQLVSLLLACIAVRKVPRASKKCPASFLAALLIGIIYLFSYFSVVALYLGMAIFIVAYAWLLILQKYGIEKLEPTFNPQFKPFEIDQFGWVKNSLNRRCLPATFGIFLAIFWSLCLGSLIGAMSDWSYQDGTAVFGYLAFFFMLSLGVGQKVAATRLPWKTGREPMVIISILLIVNIILTSVVPVLTNSAFDLITAGFALGILLETRIRFWHYRSPGNLWLSGTSWVAFWGVFIGYSSILFITFDDGFPVLPVRLLAFILFGLEAIIVGIFETLRFNKLTGAGKKSLPDVKISAVPITISIKPMDDLKPEDFKVKDKEDGWEK